MSQMDPLRPMNGLVYKLRSEAYDAIGDLEAADEQRALAQMLAEEGKECCVCFEELRTTRLHPCNHSALCAACADGVRSRGSKCPICASPFVHIEFDVDGRFAVDTYTPATVGRGAASDELRSAVALAAQLTPMQIQALLGESEVNVAEAGGCRHANFCPFPCWVSFSLLTRRARVAGREIGTNAHIMAPLHQSPVRVVARVA